MDKWCWLYEMQSYGNTLVKYHWIHVVHFLKLPSPEIVSLANNRETARWPANEHDVEICCRDFRRFRRGWWCQQWALFRQQGVTAHTTYGSMNWRTLMTGGRIASRFGDTAWPASLLTSMRTTTIFWGHFKAKLWVNKPCTLGIWKSTSGMKLQPLKKSVTNSYDYFLIMITGFYCMTGRPITKRSF
jgi:hypothetical protein